MESSNNSDDGQLRAMSLSASLRTAVEMCHALTLRRNGQDPSEPEGEATARRHLLVARQELRALVVQLRLSLAVDPASESALVRAFEDRLLLAHAARMLHLVHQRLLSLYPCVDSEVVEQARVVQAEAARLAAAPDEDFHSMAATWCDAAAGFTEGLAGALYTPN